MRLKTIKIKNMTLVTVYSAVAIFIGSVLTDKLFEGIIFFFAHWLIREQFPEQYHHIVPSVCRAISATVFFFGTCIILPLSISLLSVIPICFFSSWIGYKTKLADLYEISLNRSFNIETCTEQELRKRCEELHISSENTELAIEFFIKRTKQSIIADRLCIDEKSVTTRKKRLKQKIK